MMAPPMNAKIAVLAWQGQVGCSPAVAQLFLRCDSYVQVI